jgi:hypothetical protein
MAGFMGGSAWSMTKDIADGFVNVTDRTFQGMSGGQLGQLSHEIERLLRELRGGAVAGEPLPDLQNRQRRIQRLNSAQMIIRAFRQKVRC